MKLKANEYTYCIKNLTYDEIRRIEYAYGQHIHNAVSGDFACTNDILAQLKARIEKKPIKATTSEEDFITILKPKFRVGDKVRCLTTDNEFEVGYYCIYPLTNEVYYFDTKLSKRKKGIAESELELVEDAE